MDTKAIIKYWIEEADEALQVAEHLFGTGDYSYSLFFGHLCIEKILKAIYVYNNRKHAPPIHNLIRLAELAKIDLSADISDKMIEITTFNLEARYPDTKRTFRSLCTKDFTQEKLDEIRSIYKWLKRMIKP